MGEQEDRAVGERREEVDIIEQKKLEKYAKYKIIKQIIKNIYIEKRKQ